MGFDAHARVFNFTLENLKKFLNAYRQVPKGSSWKTANTIIEKSLPGYTRSYYQAANQLGLEYKPKDLTSPFTIQRYLVCENDDTLKKYLAFWSMLYYAPNPRVRNKHNDPAINIYVTLAKEILASSTLSIDFSAFFVKHINGNNEDITKNILVEHTLYLKFDGKNFNIAPTDKQNLQDLVDFIEKHFPLPSDIQDKQIFFDRFSINNFKKFYNFLQIPLYLKGDNLPYNQIFYGAPGTGKSFLLKQYAESCFNNIERVTFYNGYTFNQFVGGYKPVPIYEDHGTFHYPELGMFQRTGTSKPYVVYEFVPGIFLRMLIKSLNHPEQKHCLIIEELNRARPDQVFGDIFQLLDRNLSGKSEYSIQCPPEMLDYLKQNLTDTKIFDLIKKEGLYIPENLYLWATMNSADQGVYPIDSAFKRRWYFKYLSLNENAQIMDGYSIDFHDSTISKNEWNNFREKVNKLLSEEYGITEDRLIAPFFVKAENFDSGKVLYEDVFIYKIIMYLNEDVLRHHQNTDKLFRYRNFSDIVENFNKNQPIFSEDFIHELNR